MSALAELIPFLSDRKKRTIFYGSNVIETYDPTVNAGIIVPIGDISFSLLDYICANLTEKFKLSFSVTKPISLPTQAYNTYRNQFLSVSILNALNKKYNYRKVLGIINEDIYVSELDFIFGQAHIRGRSALISIKRLKEEYYGCLADEGILKQRALKEAIHEIGHTYGLNNCANYQCVMFFSNKLSDTDKKGLDFCPACLAQISEKL